MTLLNEVNNDSDFNPVRNFSPVSGILISADFLIGRPRYAGGHREDKEGTWGA